MIFCLCGGVVEVGLISLIAVGCRKCYLWVRNKFSA
jgi:hypothetical protein